MYDIIIIGMGISGITAGIYAKRSNKKVLLIDKGLPGGLLNNIDKISNYPGLINISGPDFADILETQVKELDIPYVLEEVKEVDLTKEIKKVITSNNTYETKKIIFAMGRKPKYLGLDNEEYLLGKGLSTCAMCDANFYKNESIAIVGTGNSALQEALYLANIVSHIYLINRRDGFRGEEMLVKEVKDNPKIEIIYNANIVSMNEENNKLTSELQNTTENLERIRDEAAENDSSSIEKSKLIKKYISVLGYTDVYGEGLRLKYTPIQGQYEADIATDLRDIVNELKNAGIEAISINGQRLINKSSIEMVKNKIEINTVEITSPYIIDVIGNSEMINNSLIRPGGTIENIRSTGVKIDIQVKDNIKINKFSEYTMQ